MFHQFHKSTFLVCKNGGNKADSDSDSNGCPSMAPSLLSLVCTPRYVALTRLPRTHVRTIMNECYDLKDNFRVSAPSCVSLTDAAHIDSCPYGAAYLSPPPDTGWRRYNDSMSSKLFTLASVCIYFLMQPGTFCCDTLISHLGLIKYVLSS